MAIATFITCAIVASAVVGMASVSSDRVENPGSPSEEDGYGPI